MYICKFFSSKFRGFAHFGLFFSSCAGFFLLHFFLGRHFLITSVFSKFSIYFHRENSRLKSVHHKLIMSRQCSKHFSVSIPRVLLQKRENSRKKYYAYEIQIVPIDGGDNAKWSLLRRYSEFHRLHEFLQKSNAVIATLDFPPKKHFGNMVSYRHINRKFTLANGRAN